MCSLNPVQFKRRKNNMMTVKLDDAMNTEVVIFGEYFCFGDEVVHMEQLNILTKSFEISKKGLENLYRFCKNNLSENDDI